MKKRVIIVCTELRFLRLFLYQHLHELKKSSDLYIIASDNYGEAKYFSDFDVKVINISRKISLIKDALALLRILTILFRIRPQKVISIMPKAGLLSAISSFLLRVPDRLHIFTGQVWVTEKLIWKKAILSICDKVIAKLSTQILTDGHTQSKFLVRAGIVPHSKVSTPRYGSIAGVSLTDEDTAKVKEFIITKHAGGKKEVVFLFLGRLCVDKGLKQIIDSIVELKYKNVQNFELKFLFAGQDEEDYGPTLQSLQQKNVRIRVLGFVHDPSELLKEADFLLLPSLREGFGNVVLEAYKYGCIPIVSNIYGLRDAYIKNRTAIMFSRHKKQGLTEVILSIIENKYDRSDLSFGGYQFLKERFDSKSVVKSWMKELG